jgi:hypothetical protein
MAGVRALRRYTERIDFTVPVQTKEQLKAAARREGVSMSDLVRRQVRKMMGAETSSA